jgi:hypothetical protein
VVGADVRIGCADPMSLPRGKSVDPSSLAGASRGLVVGRRWQPVRGQLIGAVSAAAGRGDGASNRLHDWDDIGFDSCNDEDTVRGVVREGDSGGVPQGEPLPQAQLTL